MMVKELPKQVAKSYIIKYDYEDCTGFGAIIVHALSHDMAVILFRKYMFMYLLTYSDGINTSMMMPQYVLKCVRSI